MICFSLLFTTSNVQSQPTGTWSTLNNLSIDFNAGVMLLLTDGTVITHTYTGGTYGTYWNKLTPDSSGSYKNGTWIKSGRG